MDLKTKLEMNAKIERRISDFWDALSHETIRGQILILTTQIDNLLLEMIQRMLKPAREKKDELFRPMAPLESFSSHVTMAHRLGLISEEYADALNMLRKLRNACAHGTKPISLDYEPHLGQFLRFTELTCKKDDLGLVIFGCLCPTTTEEMLCWVCLFHIVNMEMTLEQIDKLPDKWHVKPQIIDYEI